MTTRRLVVGLLLWHLIGCGQQELVLPEPPAGGRCGPGYPGAEGADAGDIYGIEDGMTFPCLLFESAVVDGESTYLFFPDIHLQAKHDHIDERSAVIVIGASNCPSCAVLMNDIADMVDDFEGAGAMMMTAIWCDNVDRRRCDFDLDEAVATAVSEGWPADRWPVTDDAEGHLKPGFSETFPSAIVVRLSDMQVISVDPIPSARGLFELVNTL